MSIEGQGHFFTIYLPGFVFFVLYYAKISGERDRWSSGVAVVVAFYCPSTYSDHTVPRQAQKAVYQY